MKGKKQNMTWSFSQVWNTSLATREDRPAKWRNRIWASELGGSYVDRYLKMVGVKPTNPPNARSLRKFEAGNMMEWIVNMVLKRAGILIDVQKWVAYQYSDLYEVTGKLDQKAGGKPDWKKAKSEVKELGLPKFFYKATDAIIDHLSETYPKGLNKVILETKSCSSFMYEHYKIHGADHRHEMQLFHYLKATDTEEGHIIYISKDDLRMLEFGVFNTSTNEKSYKKDIERMTSYVKNKKQPPKEPMIEFDPESEKFSANWKVGYSNYLTMLYGYKNQKEFDEKWRPIVARFNRVITRIKKGKNMTDNNLKVIEEIKEYEPDIENLVHEEEGGE